VGLLLAGAGCGGSNKPADQPKGEQSGTPDPKKGDGGAAQGDQAKLQGTWKPVKFMIGTSEHNPSKKMAAFKDDMMDFYPIADELKYKLDPSKSPKEIDLIPQSGPDKGQVYPGIYKLEGDTLTIISVNRPGRKRPGSFDMKANDRIARLYEFKRAGP
jgi:uncharacterized protein (TIGR03067 family)